MFILDQFKYFKNYYRGKNKTQGLASTERAAKPDHLSSVLRTHVVKGEKQLLQVNLWPLSIGAPWDTYILPIYRMNEQKPKHTLIQSNSLLEFFLRFLHSTAS